MTKERFDIHQHVTDKIVSAIEHGAGDFDRSHNCGIASAHTKAIPKTMLAAVV